ncbi:MAG: anti-sigma F factor [Peptococcaceae bacterium]|nr:anti-sigma F factor [Peptococcaceae bacterium]
MTKPLLNEIRIEFKSVGENVGLSRILVAALASQLDLNVNELEELKVAVSEAVSNAIIHGYGSRPDRKVSLAADLYPDEIHVTVADDGVGIEDIQKAMTPAYSTDPERMGLGFVFMQSFADQVEVTSKPGEGTRVRLVKRIGKDGAD